MANDDEEDQATIDAIRARGPQWIPQKDAQRLMDQALADAEDAAAFEDWSLQRAAGQAITIPHDEVRRRVGLDNA